MTNQRISLLLALSLVTLGTALVVMGVISPSMFNVGVYLIEIGVAGIALSGILHLVRPAGPA